MATKMTTTKPTKAKPAARREVTGLDRPISTTMTPAAHDRPGPDLNKEVRESGEIYALALHDVARRFKVDAVDILTEESTAAVERALRSPNMQYIVGWFRAIGDVYGLTSGDALALFPRAAE